MNRGNKKEAVAALHREQIMKAAEALFTEKGYEQTTIDDISKASQYSRRTLYAYYESKEDILYHIIEKGLETLKRKIDGAVNSSDDFISKYQRICIAMTVFQLEYPHSVNAVNRMNTSGYDFSSTSETVKHIFYLGTEINTILSGFIEDGMKTGVVRKGIGPVLTVYVLWSSITALLAMIQSKGKFICQQMSITEKELMEYGFRQIINSILETRI